MAEPVNLSDQAEQAYRSAVRMWETTPGISQPKREDFIHLDVPTSAENLTTPGSRAL